MSAPHSGWFGSFIDLFRTLDFLSYTDTRGFSSPHSTRLSFLKDGSNTHKSNNHIHLHLRSFTFVPDRAKIVYEGFAGMASVLGNILSGKGC